jgi:hypothetical protein
VGRLTAEAYHELRSQTDIDEVSFGYATVTLHAVDELDDAQIGYAVDPAGNPLVGRDAGDWQESWLVIGHEDLVGDPLFVDLSGAGFPVYTAAHGEGSWEANRVADSFSGLVSALRSVSSVAEGRDNPVALEGNPLPEDQRTRVLDEIAGANPSSSLEFWAAWLEA